MAKTQEAFQLMNKQQEEASKKSDLSEPEETKSNSSASIQEEEKKEMLLPMKHSSNGCKSCNKTTSKRCKTWSTG